MQMINPVCAHHLRKSGLKWMIQDTVRADRYGNLRPAAVVALAPADRRVGDSLPLPVLLDAPQGTASPHYAG